MPFFHCIYKLFVCKLLISIIKSIYGLIGFTVLTHRIQIHNIDKKNDKASYVIHLGATAFGVVGTKSVASFIMHAKLATLRLISVVVSMVRILIVHKCDTKPHFIEKNAMCLPKSK